MPPIDAELAQPLSPIEDIDAPPAGDQADAQAPVPPPAVATTAPDPALAQPLPPLAAFDVEPPQAIAAEETASAPAVRYSVVVEGMDAVGMEDQFRALSALEKGDGKGANGAVIAARAHEDEALALRILRSEGYYDAVVTSLVEPVQGQPGRATATISASPGTALRAGRRSLSKGRTRCRRDCRASDSR